MAHLDERGVEDNLSLREKSLLKRRVNKEHNSNFRAGYIHVNEDSLHKTGLRGRKRALLYCVLCILFLATAFNVLLTFGILYFMEISHMGMSSLEFILPNHDIRFLDDVSMDTGTIMQGFLGGRTMKDLVFEGHEVIFSSTTGDSSVSVGISNITLDTDDFLIINMETGKLLFSTKNSVQVKRMDTKNFHAETVRANKIISRHGVEDLYLHSFHNLDITGNEGVFIDAGGEVDFISRDDIKINPVGGSIVLDGEDGVHIARRLPKAGDGTGLPSNLTYKVCVCMPTGQVYLLPMTVPGLYCDNIDDDSLCDVF